MCKIALQSGILLDLNQMIIFCPQEMAEFRCPIGGLVNCVLGGPFWTTDDGHLML